MISNIQAESSVITRAWIVLVDFLLHFVCFSFVFFFSPLVYINLTVRIQRKASDMIPRFFFLLSSHSLIPGVYVPLRVLHYDGIHYMIIAMTVEWMILSQILMVAVLFPHPHLVSLFSALCRLHASGVRKMFSF